MAKMAIAIIWGRAVFKKDFNAYKPYEHGVWENNSKSIGGEENLEGRTNLILQSFKNVIKNHFSINQIKNMTVLDYGSYDGYFSVEIEKMFPFKKIVSLEPRKKNYLKGEYVRNYLKINSNVEFVNDHIENIDETFDIVFCCGVLHHIDNINEFTQKILKKCKKLIFIESLVYDSRIRFLNFFLNKLNIKLTEPKDIIYKNTDKFVGLVTYKYETDYVDGSCVKYLSLVSLPDYNFLKQVFFINNWKLNTFMSAKEYKKSIKLRNRVFSSAIFYATQSNNSIKDLVKKKIYEYEKFYLTTFIPLRILNIIYKYNFLRIFILLFLKKNEFVYEIIYNFKYNFNDKILFEKAKNLLKNKNIYKCARILFKIISNVKSDYRTVYRSFALLGFLYSFKLNRNIDNNNNRERERELVEQNDYLKLLKISNENYPLEIINDLNNAYKIK
jgi:2-polyprenyl-3-methyl-5-hydroxy-6-metoxy-1,4-benzoquinol methylase